MRKLDTTKKGKIRSNRKNYFNLLINDLPLTGVLFIDITTDEPAKMINNKVSPFTENNMSIFRTYFAKSYKLYNVKLLKEAIESVIAINTLPKTVSIPPTTNPKIIETKQKANISLYSSYSFFISSSLLK